MFASRTKAGRSGLTPTQDAYLASFVEAYCAKHPTSKRMTQQARKALADNRASAGFKPNTKEILFPILADRAEGSRLHDVDGNEFVDITMGFGVHLFGHNPSFVRDALLVQAERGFPIGPQSPLAGRVAELICELTGHERVVFCNSGTEATMTAVRMARAATGRRKIAIFRESYHGTFDGFLARPGGTSALQVPTSIPVSAGVLDASIADTVVLGYGEEDALEQVRKLGPELAAVIVEPVQSRRPWLQPQEFLRKLRDITLEQGIIFVWDEVITGFRIGAGGAQEYFGIRADLAAYGKVAGGGMPIGLVAGNSALLDLIDGGFWQYGDESFPGADQIFFAGTFTKHPLAMAAAVATLEKIRAERNTLYPLLNSRTSRLAQASNELFERLRMPVRVECFGSLFRYVSRKNIDLFFSHLMMEGVFVWEGRNCFLSTAHTDADIDFILRATENAIQRLQSGGFTEERPEPQTVPVNAWARRFTSMWTPSTASALNIGGGVLIRGMDPVGQQHLQKSVEAVLGGEGVCAQFDPVQQRWLPSARPLRVTRLAATPQAGETVEALATRLVDAEMARPFSPGDEAQVRATLSSLGDEGPHLLTLTANHCVCDGYSFSLALEAIFSNAQHPGGATVLPDSGRYVAEAEARYRQSQDFKRDHQYWSHRLQAHAGFEYQSDCTSSRRVSRLNSRVDGKAVPRLAQVHRTSAFAVLATAWQLAFQEDESLAARGVMGIPLANRSVLDDDRRIAQVSNILPLVLDSRTSTRNLSQMLQTITQALREMQQHGAYPLLTEVNAGTVPIAMSLNLEPSAFEFPSGDFDATVIFGKRSAIEFPIELNMVRQGTHYDVICDHRDELVSASNALLLVSRFEQLLTTWSQNAD